MTPAGIEPPTFRFLAQHLNHCATAVPYQREFFKKIPRLGTLCTQSVNEGIIIAETYHRTNNIHINQKIRNHMEINIFSIKSIANHFTYFSVFAILEKKFSSLSKYAFDHETSTFTFAHPVFIHASENGRPCYGSHQSPIMAA